MPTTTRSISERVADNDNSYIKILPLLFADARFDGQGNAANKVAKLRLLKRRIVQYFPRLGSPVTGQKTNLFEPAAMTDGQHDLFVKSSEIFLKAKPTTSSTICSLPRRSSTL